MRTRAVVCVFALGVGVMSGATPAGAQAASASISGVVTSPAGEPLEGVCVEVFGDDFGTTTTSSDGSYEIGPLEAGTFSVGVNTCGDRLPGYAPEFFDDARTAEDAEPVVLVEGEARRDIGALLEPTGAVSGTVVDDGTGLTLTGVCVEAFVEDADDFGSGRTDESGSYVIDDLPAGSYTVIFFDCADPLVHVAEFYNDVPVVAGEPARDPQTVVVTSGHATGGVNARLTEGGAVQGTITGLHTGRPQARVCAALFEQDAEVGDPPVSLTFSGLLPAGGSDRRGDYTLGGVPPGSYVLEFNSALCLDNGYVTTSYNPTRDEATLVVVTRGEVTTEVDGVVTPMPSIAFACPSEIAPDSRQFEDVPEGNVHAIAIECLALFGIVRGSSERSYNPASPVTRAQLASFVARSLEAAGVTLPNSPANAFDDDNGSVHEATINQLAALGVVRGVGDRRYAPAQTVNRGQMASFLVNAYERATGAVLQAPQDRFADDGGNTHERNINKAATAGITAGTGSGYAPGGQVQRDQMASFLARLLDRVQRDVLGTGVDESEQAGPT